MYPRALMNIENSVLDVILERVERGIITPEAAEMELNEFWTIPRLRTLDWHHPRLSHWNFEMIIAWIRWGTLEKVLRHCELSYEGTCVWKRSSNLWCGDPDECMPKEFGWTLVELTKTSVMRPYVDSTGTDVLPEENFEAITKFCRSMRSASVQARAADCVDKIVVPVSQDYWIIPHVDFIDGETTFLVDKTPRYKDVTMKKEDVVSLWPGNEHYPVSDMVRFIPYKAEAEFKDFLFKNNRLMPYYLAIKRTYPNGIPRGKSKTDLTEEIREVFGIMHSRYVEYSAAYKNIDEVLKVTT